MRTKLHRKENGNVIAIATAIVYIKDGSVWRPVTKSEGDVLEIQNGITSVNPPIEISTTFPAPDSGTDGDYYALLYPLDWDGEVWAGTG